MSLWGWFGDNFDTPLSFPPAPSSGQNDNLSNHFFYDLISETLLTFPSASVELWSCTLCYGWSTLASVGMQICSTKMGNMESIISDAAVSIRALSIATFPLHCTAQLNWLDMLLAQVNLFDFVYHCSWYSFSVGRIISLFIVMLGKIAFIIFNTTQTYRNNGRYPLCFVGWPWLQGTCIRVGPMNYAIAHRWQPLTNPWPLKHCYLTGSPPESTTKWRVPSEVL